MRFSKARAKEGGMGRAAFVSFHTSSTGATCRISGHVGNECERLGKNGRVKWRVKKGKCCDSSSNLFFFLGKFFFLANDLTTSKEQKKKKTQRRETHCENFAERIAPCYLILLFPGSSSIHLVTTISSSTKHKKICFVLFCFSYMVSDWLKFF